MISNKIEETKAHFYSNSICPICKIVMDDGYDEEIFECDQCGYEKGV